MARLLIAWIIGIVTGLYLNPSLPGLAIPALAAVLIYHFTGVEFRGFIILFWFAVLGCLRVILMQPPHPPGSPSMLYIEPFQDWEASANGWKNRGSFTVRQRDGWYRYSHDIAIYLSQEGWTRPPEANFLLHGSINTGSKALNPGAFDFSRYQKDQGIIGSIFIPADAVMTVPRHRDPGLPELLRWRLLTNLRPLLPDARERGLAEALLIGYKADMDKSLGTAYSNAGVVHVIAISGLHLGLIYAILMALASILRIPVLLRSVLILGAIWVFSLAAGGGPSVVRSAVMFSMLALGELLARQKAGIHSLLAVGFIMLVVHPVWVRDAGFQLSFAALSGILLYQRRIAALWQPANRLMQTIWELCAVTLAAQIFTIPLCLYYFHQLPILFLVTNIIMAPLSSLALLLALVVSIFPATAIFLSAPLDICLKGMNEFVLYMNRCPFISWQGWLVSLSQALALTIMLAALMEKKRLLLLLSLAGMCLLQLLRIREVAGREALVLYDSGKSWAVEWIGHGVSNLYCDSVFLNARNQSWILDKSALELQFHRKQVITAEAEILHMRWKDKTFLYVLKAPERAPAQILQKWKPQNIVLGGSLSRRAKDLWIKSAPGCRIWDIRENGAWYLEATRPSLLPLRTSQYYNGKENSIGTYFGFLQRWSGTTGSLSSSAGGDHLFNRWHAEIRGGPGFTCSSG